VDRLELVSLQRHTSLKKSTKPQEICSFVVREWNANDAADPWSTLRIDDIDTFSSEKVSQGL